THRLSILLSSPCPAATKILQEEHFMTAEERLQTLEQELSRQRQRQLHFVILGLCFVVLPWLLGARPVQPQKEIHTNRFVLEDEKGNARGIFSMDKDGPRLDLLDQKGESCATLLVSEPLGPVLMLADASGNIRNVLSVNEKLGAALVLSDPAAR